MSTVDETFEFNLEQLSFGAFFTLPERADDRLAVGLTLILITYGILANITLVVTVLGSKEMRGNPSYFLLIQMAVCDLVILFLAALYQMGGIVFRQAFLGSSYSTLNFTLHFFLQCAWWIFVCSLTLTAFNRFVCIVFVGRYGALFTRRSTLLVIFINCLVGLGMAAPALTPCCKVLWFFDEWTSSYFPVTTWYIQFDFVVTLTTIGIIIVCYCGVIWQVRRKQATVNGKKSRGELRIALQVGLMCGIYILSSVMWNFVPYMEASKWTNAALNATTSLQCAMHPSIAFLFNGTIRRQLLGAIDPTRRKSQVQSITISSQATTTSRVSIPNH